MQWHADAHMLEKTAAYLQRRNAASQQLKADPQPPFVVHRNRRLSAMANLMQQQQQQQQAPSAAAAVAVRQLHELRELLDPEALAGEPARRCPLCMRRMWDPVRIRSGVDLDRSCFKRWLDRLQQEALPPVCPVTGKPLPARWKGQVPAECEELQRTAAQGWARVWAAAARCADQLSIPAAVGGLPAAPPLPPPLAAQHDANGTAVAPSLPPPPPPPAAGGPSSWADVAGRLRTAAPPAAAELPPPQPELPPASPWTDGRVAVATPQAPGAATAVAAATALPSDAAAAPVEEAWPSVAPTELDAEALDAYGNENSAVPSLESSLPDAASTAGSSDTARHGIHVVAGTHYRPRKELAPVFEAVGESSKLLYTAADARRVFERYIKQEDLEDGPATRPYIELDDALEDALDGVPMKDRPTKKEVFGQLMRKMEPHWLVMRNDKEAIHKGPQPRAVRVSVTMDRWGKTQQGVTEVEGLGNFLVKPEEAVNVLKAALPNRLARVRSITDPRGGGQRTTVQIQGSLVDRVMDILVHRLGMPEKYVSAGDQKF